MVYTDANIFIRFIVNDNEIMADYAENLLLTESVFILHEVLAEMVFVLNKVYHIERAEISEQLSDLLQFMETSDKNVMLCALKFYGETKLDFVDCVLWAYNNQKNIEIVTFDKKLKNKLK
ncbi:MAG: PIN domain-containing protein [Spirochaetales bacterium]|nr:PIN domain-containing protein [Spirochaetales bacterium]